MGTATADVTFWAFAHYVKNNRYKSFEAMTEGDFDNLLEGFARENSTELSSADPVSLGSDYTDIEWPGAITAARNTKSTDQADYFEGHGKKAKWGA